MLRKDSNQFLWKYETNMYGGNKQWADPAEAHQVGETIGEELFARHQNLDRKSDSPIVSDSAVAVLVDALKCIDYAALPTERRENILHGVIHTLAECGVLGGEPEWVDVTAVSRS